MNIETPVRVTEDHSPAEACLLRSFETQIAGERDARLRQLREQAIAAFARAGLPHRRVEEWKYTDLRAKMREAYAPAPRAEVSEADIQRAIGHFTGLDAHVVAFVNGYHQPMPAIDAPHVQIMSLTQATGDQPGSVATRNLILVEDSAQASIIEHHVSLSETPFQTFTMTELAAGQGAQIEHLKIQDENTGSTQLANWNLRLQADVGYRGTHLNVGGALTRNQVFLRYAGENASAAVNGVCLGRDAQHFDTTMLIEHAVPHCMSRELVKSVLDDKSRSVFQAKVHVHPGAQKTDGKQMANALLLSDEAEFDSKPELEIYADDVVCGHGSTSGELDADAMFYLRSRGLPEAQARALLIAAFVDEVFDDIESDALREALTARTADWLNATVEQGA